VRAAASFSSLRACNHDESTFPEYTKEGCEELYEGNSGSLECHRLHRAREDKTASPHQGRESRLPDIYGREQVGCRAPDIDIGCESARKDVQ
jgi:hypothetical protein